MQEEKQKYSVKVVKGDSHERGVKLKSWRVEEHED